MRAVIYTRDRCDYCVKAKALLTEHNIPYEELIVDVYGRDNRILNVNQKWTTKKDLLVAYPEAKTVPQIWLDGQHVGGFTDLLNKIG